jgi:uncharacterized protein (DUF58 family)
MSGRTFAALALVAAGFLLGAPGLGLVGIVALLIAGLGRLTARIGLRGVSFERRLGRDRMVWGDEIPLDLVIRNDKLMPLPLLVAEDTVSEGVLLRGRPPTASERPGWFSYRHAWTLAWYERVVRHERLVGDRRGRFVLGPTRIVVADIFGRDAATTRLEHEHAYVVRPRTIPVHERAPANAPLGHRRAPAGIFEEPTLFAGVRPYRAGDPPRRIHWRATARMGTPASKRYDSPRSREALIALDVQTVDGPYWRRDVDEERLEDLAVAVASLARTLLRDGVATGLAIAAHTGRREPIAWLQPRTGPAQLALVADALGRMGPVPSAPFDHVLASIPRRVPPGTSITVVTSRDPAPWIPTLRRASAAGYDVRLVLVGGAESVAAAARRAGIPVAVASLRPDWRSADALELVG